MVNDTVNSLTFIFKTEISQSNTLNASSATRYILPLKTKMKIQARGLLLSFYLHHAVTDSDPWLVIQIWLVLKDPLSICTLPTIPQPQPLVRPLTLTSKFLSNSYPNLYLNPGPFLYVNSTIIRLDPVPFLNSARLVFETRLQ